MSSFDRFVREWPALLKRLCDGIFRTRLLLLQTRARNGIGAMVFDF